METEATAPRERDTTADEAGETELRHDAPPRARAPAPAVVYSGVVGQLQEFDPRSDSISAYVERAELFLDANNVPEEKQVATFLSSMGKSTYETLRNLVTPANPKDKDLRQIIAVLKEHFKPKPLIISERFNFNRRQQGATESIAEYVADLRRLTIHCKFGNFLDDALRDRFVCGLRSEVMQKKLLVESTLTFQRAIEIAQSMEAAASNTKHLQSHVGSQKGVNKLTFQSERNSCYRCGRQNHQPGQCPFKGAKCHNCGKMGQLADSPKTPNEEEEDLVDEDEVSVERSRISKTNRRMTIQN